MHSMEGNMVFESRLSRRAAFLISAGLTGVLYPAGASAQVGAPEEQQQNSGGLEEIVVTAQKRGENLQSVPVAVSAITASGAQERGVSSTLDLQQVVPNLTIAHSGQSPAIFLRGVGTQNTTAGEESSNSVYVDGVYYSALPASLLSLNNIERIEVLKGPQGTLFGRNATGGLLHIITKEPSRTTEANASIGYGNYETVEAQSYVTGPLSETLAADLSVYYKEQFDAWGTNLTNGKDVYTGGQYGVRSKMLWTPGDATRVILSGDTSRSSDSFTAAAAILPGALGLGGQPHGGGFYDITSNLQPYSRIKNSGVSLRVEHEFDFAQLVSLSAYRDVRVRVDTDQDRVALRLVDALIRSKTEQVSQELQLQALPSSPVQWIVGAFYLKSKADLHPLELAGGAQAAIGGYVQRYAVQDTSSVAVFSQATVPLGARTNVTAGVRYTIDHRDLDAYDITGVSAPNRVNVVNKDKTFRKLTWRLAADHHFTDDVMLFASYSRGFKSGVFNLFAPTGPAVNPEVLDAYEVGLKTELLDRRVRFNTSVFHYDYDNIQLLQAIPGGARILNAARARVRGWDNELTVAPTTGITLNASFSLLDGKYTSFPNAPATFPSPATCTTSPPSQLPGPRTGGNTTCAIDASGNQMIRSPKATLSLGATYELDTSAGKFAVAGNYYHSSSYPFEPDGRLRQPAYDTLNAQVSWAPTENYRIRVWGRNLTKTKYYLNLISSVGDVYLPAAPRTYGISLDWTM